MERIRCRAADEVDYREALRVAERFLGRFRDQATVQTLDDLAQEAVLELWKRREKIRDPERSAAFVRTIARRVRYRNLLKERERDEEPLEATVPAPERSAPRLFIGSRWVERDWLIGCVMAEIGATRGMTRDLFREFYAGRSCAELAATYGVREGAIRARLHRGRDRIRRRVEARVRRAGVEEG